MYRKMKQIIKFLVNPIFRFSILTKYGFFNHLSDEKFLKKKYKLIFGYELNLKNPKTFNEKLQWLKLYNRNPLYTIMVDKYKVKEYVANIIGKECIIPTLGVWNTPEEIDFDKLPNKFVLKCNHNSGLGMCICKDKNKLNIKKVKKELAKGLKQNYYLTNREWPYKNVPRKIIAEQYIEDNETHDLKDYKIFNFDGNPKLIQVDYDRFIKHKRNIYSIDWKYLNVSIQYPNDSNYIIDKPKSLDLMLELAKKLSAGVPHVRTDFYFVNEKIYFGELTFYHGSGLEKITPKEWDKKIGDWLVLPKYLFIGEK